MHTRISSLAAVVLWLGPTAMASPQEAAANPGDGVQEWKLGFFPVTTPEFPFETNAETGGGGCAPPKRSRLRKQGGASCIPLVVWGFMVEPQASKIFVDTDGDGKTDKEIKGTAGTATLQVTYPGGVKSSYAVRLHGKGDGTWTFERWCWKSGRVNGVPVTLIDENSNGVYDEKGVDRIVVGEGNCAMPLSDVVVLGDNVLQLEVDPSGTTVRTRPYTGELGSVDLMQKFKGRSKLASAVLRQGDIYIDVARSGGVPVPAGKYELFSGVISALPQVAHVRQGDMPRIEVAAGKATVVEWGAGVTIAFSFAYAESTVTISPTQIRVLGSCGEEYFAFKPMAFTPTIEVRDPRNNAVVQKGTMCLG